MKMSEHHAWFIKGKTHTVEIKCWQWSETEWAWNVYAHIFETHPLFGNPKRIYENAPLSGGCTYDKAEISSPYQGVVYDHQRINRKYVFGCDYKHIWDDDYSNNTHENMPWKVKSDAEILFEWLENAK